MDKPFAITLDVGSSLANDGLLAAGQGQPPPAVMGRTEGLPRETLQPCATMTRGD